MKFYIYILFFASLCFNLSCVTYPKVIYDVVDENGKRLSSVKEDINSYNELLDKGSVLYFEYFHLGNKKYNQVAISLYTKEKYKFIKIHDMEFIFEDQKVHVNIKKNVKLFYQEQNLFVVDSDSNIKFEVYYNYINYNQNTIKIYLQNIFFKNEKDINKKINLTLKINYSLDNGIVLEQEIKYLVIVCKGRPDRPEWMYRFFPEI